MLDGITKAQLRSMPHCIGLARPGGAPSDFVARNHYCAGQSQLADWHELVASGLARCEQRSATGLSTFSLTESGIERARRAG